MLIGYVTRGASFPKPLREEQERDCLKRMAGGDESARDCLIEHNLRLVAHVARKYIRSGQDMDDLISIGTIGLIMAVNTYDG
ncbi:MAG: sigma factor, partial [Christensenellaceae bacterium]